MLITIKPYARVCLALLTIIFVLQLAACSTVWTSEASSIISLLVPAIEAALGILAAFGVGISPAALSAVASWGQQAQAALAQVKTLIDQYNAAEASAQPGILTEIQTALSVITSGLATLLPTLHVDNPTTQQKITDVFDAIAGEVSALIALVPALQGNATSHDELKALIAQVKSPKEFKADFNAKAGMFGDQYRLK